MPFFTYSVASIYVHAYLKVCKKPPVNYIGRCNFLLVGSEEIDKQCVYIFIICCLLCKHLVKIYSGFNIFRISCT